MSEETQFQVAQENQVKPAYTLKTGLKLNQDQKKKILRMPLENMKVSIEISGENKIASIDIGQFSENQRNVVDYLIPLFFEGQNGEAVNLDDLEMDEYEKMEAKVKEINPFKVFDIKAM